MNKLNQTKKEIEILLRGETLYYSAQIEGIIDTIIIIGNGDNPDYEGFNLRDKLFNKIELAISTVKDKVPEIYEKYKSTFIEINSINFRHQMAHAIMVIKDDKMEFSVWENKNSSKDSGKIEVKYSITEANNEIKRLALLSDNLKVVLSEIVQFFENRTGVILPK